MNRSKDAPRIVSLKTVSDLSDAVSRLREIFFLTSARKNFSSEQDHVQFFAHWTSYYLNNCPEETLLALENSHKVIGYLTGCRDSQTAIPHLQSPTLELFIDQLESYPAHFHINIHPEHQGQGIGKHLIESYCEILKKFKVPGVHIITATNAANVSFYRKLGFAYECRRQLKETSLVFMGRIIS